MSRAPHITVAAVIEKDNKFLFVEEVSDGKQVINQPAGHIENGESIETAMIRETLEETGWSVKPEFLIAVYRWSHNKSGETFIRFTFSAKALSHDPALILDQGIIRPLWLTQAELQKEQARWRSPMVMVAIEDYLAGKRYPLSLLVDL